MLPTQISANYAPHKALQKTICQRASSTMARTLEWHVGHVVANLRNDRKWTQAKLAEEAGIGRQAVGKVERNDPGQRAGNLKKVAEALGYTEPELYAMVPRKAFLEPMEPPRARQDPHATAGFRSAKKR